MHKILTIIFIDFIFICFLASSVFATDKVEINTASLEQLDEITGIGPALGQRIIDARPFSSVNDLIRVAGIGEKTLKKIKDQGLAYVDCVSPASSVIASEVRPEGDERGNPEQEQEPWTATSAPEVPPRDDNVIYPDGVFINEILPNPEGSDETDEWIEIYNSNKFEIDLSDWKIQDIGGTIKTHNIPKNTKILASGFLIFKRPDTKIMLNNDEDGLKLLTPDNKVVDFAVYTKAPLGQSYNKTMSGWQWSTTITPNTNNVITGTSVKEGPKILPKIETSVKNNNIGVGLADISQSISLNQKQTQNDNPWLLFFLALVITIISATVVLFIKFRIRSSG